MRSRLLAGIALATMLAGCATTEEPNVASAATETVKFPELSGVFAEPSTLPFKTTDFSRIQDSDYRPGFEQAMADQRAEVAAIVANPDSPTFNNTIVALEMSGRMLGRVNAAFSTVTGAHTNDTLDAIDAEMSPRLTAHFDAISLAGALRTGQGVV